MHPHEARIQALRLIKQYPFPGAGADDVAALLSQGYRMEFQNGQVICTEGEAATCMYLLIFGKVQVHKRDHFGKDRAVASMFAPAIFGHMSMVDGSPRSATCTADGTVTVVVLDRETYQHLVTGPGAVGRTLRRMLLSSLSDQLARGNKRIRELTGGVEEPPTERTAVAHPVREVTEEDISEVSSELEGWRLRPPPEESDTDDLSINDADGPVRT